MYKDIIDPPGSSLGNKNKKRKKKKGKKNCILSFLFLIFFFFLFFLFFYILYQQCMRLATHHLLELVEKVTATNNTDQRAFHDGDAFQHDLARYTYPNDES